MDRLADYFVVCGLPSEPQLLDPSRAPEAERARDIMELAVVFGGDEAPEGYMTIQHTYHGAKANFDQMQTQMLEAKSGVFLAFRRRDRDELGPAISNIEVVYTGRGDAVPRGYVLLDRTPLGKSANLVPSSKGVFLAVRRQDWRAAKGAQAAVEGGAGHLEPAVQDVCVVLVGRGETTPPGFALIDKVRASRAARLLGPRA